MENFGRFDALEKPTETIAGPYNALANDVTNYATKIMSNCSMLLVYLALPRWQNRRKQAKPINYQRFLTVQIAFQCAKHIGVDILDISYQGSDIDLKYEKKPRKRLKKKEQLQEKERANAKERLEDFKLSMAWQERINKPKRNSRTCNIDKNSLTNKAKLKANAKPLNKVCCTKRATSFENRILQVLERDWSRSTKYLVATVSSKVCEESTQNVNSKEDAKGTEPSLSPPPFASFH